MIGRQYLDGHGPFQQRLPVSGLMWRFLWEYNTTVLRWARWARAEVEAWPDDLRGMRAEEWDCGRLLVGMWLVVPLA
jgi:hypothetical protein